MRADASAVALQKHAWAAAEAAVKQEMPDIDAFADLDSYRVRHISLFLSEPSIPEDVQTFCETNVIDAFPITELRITLYLLSLVPQVNIHADLSRKGALFYHLASSTATLSPDTPFPISGPLLASAVAILHETARQDADSDLEVEYRLNKNAPALQGRFEWDELRKEEVIRMLVDGKPLVANASQLEALLTASLQALEAVLSVDEEDELT